MKRILTTALFFCVALGRLEAVDCNGNGIDDASDLVRDASTVPINDHSILRVTSRWFLRLAE